MGIESIKRKILSRANANNINKSDDVQYSERSKENRKDCTLRRTVNLRKYANCLWHTTKWSTHVFFILFISRSDRSVRKLQ